MLRLLEHRANPVRVAALLGNTEVMIDDRTKNASRGQDGGVPQRAGDESKGGMEEY